MNKVWKGENREKMDIFCFFNYPQYVCVSNEKCVFM